MFTPCLYPFQCKYFTFYLSSCIINITLLVVCTLAPLSLSTCEIEDVFYYVFKLDWEMSYFYAKPVYVKGQFILWSRIRNTLGRKYVFNAQKYTYIKKIFLSSYTKLRKVFYYSFSEQLKFFRAKFISILNGTTRKQWSTRLVSSMIHSAIPTVLPIVTTWRFC